MEKHNLLLKAEFSKTNSEIAKLAHQIKLLFGMVSFIGIIIAIVKFLS